MWHDIPGLDRPIWLPDWITFKVMLVPASHTLQRPGYKLWSKHPKWIGHETGNYRAGAGPLSQVNYVINGALDQYGDPQPVSFHFTGDDDTVYLLVPADEVTWQAACGGCGGNYDCWSYEQCVNPETDQPKARKVHAYVAAGMLEAADTPATSDNVTIHYDWNNVYSGGPNDPRRHKCPELMLKQNYVPSLESDIAQFWVEARAERVKSEVPVEVIPPKPVYPSVSLPPFWTPTEDQGYPSDQKWNGATCYVVQRNIRCISVTGTNPLTYPSSISAGAKVAGEKIRAGQKKRLNRLWVNPDDGKTYGLTQDGFWVLMSKFTPRIRIDPRVDGG